MTRLCAKCRHHKGPDKFYPSGRREFALSWCRSCVSEFPEAYQFAYAQLVRAQTMLSAARSRARADNLSFDLTIDDLLPMPTHCPVLGTALDYNTRSRAGASDASPSLDRKEPARGYVKDNVAVISFRANRLKSNCTSGDELRLVADYIDQTVW